MRSVLLTALLALPALALDLTGASSIVSFVVSSQGDGARSTADLEQMRDELPGLQLDLAAGILKLPEDVRQPNLREFMLAAQRDEAVMRAVRLRHEGLRDVEALAVVAAEDLL